MDRTSCSLWKLHMRVKGNLAERTSVGSRGRNPTFKEFLVSISQVGATDAGSSLYQQNRVLV